MAIAKNTILYTQNAEYRILARIAEGALGEIFKARVHRISRPRFDAAA